MTRRSLAILPILSILAAMTAQAAQERTPPPAAEPSRDTLVQSLAQVERDFAAAFAERDKERFASFLAEGAVFLSPDGTALRGKDAILEGWADFFTGDPPFSWYPTVSEVSGDLGLSQGPVLSPKGEWLANFSSVWRRQDDGTWKVVFDGAPPCRSLVQENP